MSMDYSGTSGDYHYYDTQYGKGVSGVLKNGPQSVRNEAAQRSAGGIDREAGDQGGHLLAHRFGGRNDASNLDAQAANVNQKDQASVERNIAGLLNNPNNTVAMSVNNFNSVGDRPTATMMNVGVQDNITGEIDEQHISFQNANHDLQQEWNNTVNQVASDIDPAQNMGMNDEQRETANDLCGEENTVDDRLGSGWTYMEFDSSFLDADSVEQEEGESMEEAEALPGDEIEYDMEDNAGDGMDCGM